MGNEGKIMTQQHIDNDTLTLYVKTTSLSDPQRAGADNKMNSTLYLDVVDHLAACEICRNQASIISTLLDQWTDIRQPTELTDDQHKIICDYVDGLLPTDEAEQVRCLLENQPQAMKAALHYQTHTTAMQTHLSRDVNVPQPKAASQPSRDYLLSRVKTWGRLFFSIQSPMVYTMSATATLIIAVLLLVVQYPQDQHGQTMIASYQDNPTIQFTDENKLPGVGFFSQSGNTSKAFEDVRIELIAENTVKISWPEVDGATLYKMRIQVFNQGRKTMLRENSTQTNHTTFLLEPDSLKTNTDANNIQHINKRYEWVLYGNTKDDRTFYATGGFVISRIDANGDQDNDTW